MKRLVQILSVGVIGIFFWVIYMADTNQRHILLDFWYRLSNGDKLGHIVLFGALTLAVNIVTQHRRLFSGRFKPFLGSLLVVLAAIAEEFSQLLFPLRTVSIFDLLASMVGIGLASLISIYLCRKTTDF